MIWIPFPGGKRLSYKRFVEPLCASRRYISVFEPFGGSCVLSVNLKRDGHVNRAVINDYDGLFSLYPEFLDIKDWIVRECESKGFRNVRHSPLYGWYYWNDGERVFLETGVLEPAAHVRLHFHPRLRVLPQKYSSQRLQLLRAEFVHRQPKGIPGSRWGL